MIAGRLTMIAQVERNGASGKDGWGNPVAPVFVAVGALACFIWSNDSRSVTDGQKSGEIEDLRGLFPLGADLLPNDEFSSVTDRSGAAIVPGRLRVLGPVQRKHTHLEAMLRRIG